MSENKKVTGLLGLAAMAFMAVGCASVSGASSQDGAPPNIATSRSCDNVVWAMQLHNCLDGFKANEIDALNKLRTSFIINEAEYAWRDVDIVLNARNCLRVNEIYRALDIQIPASDAQPLEAEVSQALGAMFREQVRCMDEIIQVSRTDASEGAIKVLRDYRNDVNSLMARPAYSPF